MIVVLFISLIRCSEFNVIEKYREKRCLVCNMVFGIELECGFGGIMEVGDWF